MQPCADGAQEGHSLGPKPRTRKMIGMISVILAAIGVILAGYLAVGFAGYVAYPHTVSSNVLKTFPGNPLMQARAAPALPPDPKPCVFPCLRICPHPPWVQVGIWNVPITHGFGSH